MPMPSVGRIVQYVLSQDDAERINDRRVRGLGYGNTEPAGDVRPLIVVRVWPDEFGPGIPGVNGQALLDGNDQLWITSAKEDAAGSPGTWHWPERA